MRGVIRENILSWKYQKQATTAALNGEDALMLLPTALRKSWKYQVLPFLSVGLFHLSRILIGNFAGVLILNFVPDWESEILNQSSLPTNSSEN